MPTTPTRLSKKRPQPPLLQRSSQWLKPMRPVVAAFVAIIGVAAAAITFLPRLSVETSGPFVPSSNSQGTFEIKNAGQIPLEDLRIYIGLCYFHTANEFGDPPDQVLLQHEDANCNKWPRKQWPRILPLWMKHKFLGLDEHYTITLTDIIGAKKPAQFGAADIGIIVSYKPWFLPWRRESETVFVSRILSDGNGYWFAQ